MPIAILVAGIISVGYGVWGHMVPIVQKPEKPEATESEAEAEEPPPPPPPADPWMNGPPSDPWMSGPPSDPWMNGPPPDEPPPEEEPDETADEEPAAKPPEEKILDEPEPVLIREVTVGGVSRSASGQIVRTYAANEKPAALCPT
ncbi:MAG: hypothetical protein JW719_02350 [Pirellulales bacterium]|nr:hypothetical protein [Pirellulales bacterium]